MKWKIEYLPEAEADLKKLDGSVRPQVVKGIQKIAGNPLSSSEGGYGKPLGNKLGNDLTNLLKIKFSNIGIRVVYKIIKDKKSMKIIVISARSDNEVYDEAEKRKNQNDL